MFKVTAERPGSSLEQYFDNFDAATDRFTELRDLGFSCTVKRVYNNFVSEGNTTWTIH